MEIRPIPKWYAIVTCLKAPSRSEYSLGAASRDYRRAMRWLTRERGERGRKTVSPWDSPVISSGIKATPRPVYDKLVGSHLRVGFLQDFRGESGPPVGLVKPLTRS